MRRGGFEGHRLAILKRRDAQAAIFLLGGKAVRLRERDRAQARILTEDMRDVHGHAAVGGPNVLELVVNDAGCGEDGELSGEDIDQQTRKGDKEHDGG